MLSRLADSTYWMSRYIERAENVARFIDVNLYLMLDQTILKEEQQWLPLVVTTGDYADFHSRYGNGSRENVLKFLIFDTENPNSIISCLQKARENARTMREVISSEMWTQVNGFYHMVQNAVSSQSAKDFPQAFCKEVKQSSHLFTGITDATFSHGEAWHFIQLGQLFERADKTARILDVKYFILLPKVEDIGTPIDLILWTALLKSASAYEMYRKKFNRIDPFRIAEFLAFDSEFPRSMRYCLVKAEESLRAITGTPTGTYANAAEQMLGRLRTDLNYGNIQEVIRSGLHEYLDSFETKLNSVGEALFAIYLAPSPVPGYSGVKRIDQ
jgi:uncharacterized alpha-E superfamily protein